MSWDRFRLLIPGYGRILRHQYYAQFSRTLGTLMENGIPLLRALDLVTEIAGNKYLEAKLARSAAGGYRRCKSLDRAGERRSFFPNSSPT